MNKNELVNEEFYLKYGVVEPLPGIELDSTYVINAVEDIIMPGGQHDCDKSLTGVCSGIRSMRWLKKLHERFNHDNYHEMVDGVIHKVTWELTWISYSTDNENTIISGAEVEVRFLAPSDNTHWHKYRTYVFLRDNSLIIEI